MNLKDKATAEAAKRAATCDDCANSCNFRKAGRKACAQVIYTADFFMKLWKEKQ